ncbi:MAG: membrane protein insertase YidC [Candidatus Eiseniibacteriota bacterium]
MDRRTLLAIVLSFIVLFGSQWVFQKLGWIPRPTDRKPASTAVAPGDTLGGPGATELQSGAGGTGAVSGPGGTAPGIGAGAGTAAGTVAGMAAGASGQAASGWIVTASPDTILTIEQPLYTARFRARGARLLSVALKKYKDGNSGIATLADSPALGLDLGTDDRPLSMEDVPYAWAESLDASGRVAVLTFSARDTTGFKIDQTFRFEETDYRMPYTVAMTGLPTTGDLRDYRILMRSWPLVTERTHSEDLNNLGVTAKVGKDNKRHMAGSLKKEPKSADGAIGWLALHSKYFLLGLVADDVKGTATRASLAPGTLPETHDQVQGTITVPLPAAGRAHSYVLYAGPLDYWRVGRLGMDLEPPHAFLFNAFKPFSAALVWIMKLFHSLIHNWGVAIILLSTVAKIVTHPLQATSMKSMRSMQKIQPEVERIRKRHEKDPQKLNEAIMGLYKENKINPLAGCLPMVIQMPFFLALYHVLGYSIDLRQAGFVGWINDLSAPDLLFQLGPIPVRVLPILMLGSMLLQMKMTPMDPKQVNTMMLMNVVFLFLFYNLPSGLVLYWTVINLLTALQSWHIAQGDRQPAARAA